MYRTILMRLSQAVPVLLIFSVMVFMLMHLLPGDPAVAIAGPEAPPEAVEKIREQLGLNRPLIVQLLEWFAHLAVGNFGESLTLKQSVISAVLERLPVTMSLSLISLLVTLPVGIGLGVVAAYWRNSWIDAAVMITALLGVSLGWFPPSGYVPIDEGGLWGWFAALIQPAVVLALFQIGFLARITRSAMLDVLDQDFIRTARAKGVDEWTTVAKHAFRNTLIPVVTVLGITLSLLIGGSVVIEQVFALPGIGRLIVQGILNRDYPLVQGTMLLFGFAFVVINILVDIIYTFVDPRVRYG